MAQNAILSRPSRDLKQRCATFQQRFQIEFKMHMTRKRQTIPTRTSLMADQKTHEYVRELARELGISQTKCLAMIIDEKKHRYKLESKRKAEQFNNLDVQTALNQINARLVKIEKRENPRDTIVSFFRTQEKDILKPMNEEICVLTTKLDDIIKALSELR